MEDLGGLRRAHPRHRHRGLPRLPARPHAAARPATTSSASTPATTRPAGSTTARRAPRRPSRRTSATCTVERPRGRRRGRAHGRAVQRPDRRPDRRRHLRHQPPRLGAPGRAGQGGRRRSGSSTCPRAASTASPTAPSTRPARPTRRPPTRGARRWSSATSRALADDGFSPTFLRNATAFGASPRMRFDIVLNNLAGLAWTEKQDRDDQRRHPVAPAGPRPGHRQGDPRGARRAARGRARRRCSTSAATSSNYPVRDIAEIVAAAFPGCEVTLRRRPSADNRSYRVAFDQDPRGAARLRVRLGRRHGCGPAARGLRAHRPGRRAPSPAAATPGSSSSST